MSLIPFKAGEASAFPTLRSHIICVVQFGTVNTLRVLQWVKLWTIKAFPRCIVPAIVGCASAFSINCGFVIRIVHLRTALWIFQQGHLWTADALINFPYETKLAATDSIVFINIISISSLRTNYDAFAWNVSVIDSAGCAVEIWHSSAAIAWLRTVGSEWNLFIISF